mgnify:CR=1 FL=1
MRVGSAVLQPKESVFRVTAEAGEIRSVVVEEGSVEQVYNIPSHPYTEALLSAVPIPDPVVEKLIYAFGLGTVVSAEVGDSVSPEIWAA